jgi:hypothetical protein
MPPPKVSDALKARRAVRGYVRVKERLETNAQILGDECAGGPVFHVATKVRVVTEILHGAPRGSLCLVRYSSFTNFLNAVQPQRDRIP